MYHTAEEDVSTDYNSIFKLCFYFSLTVNLFGNERFLARVHISRVNNNSCTQNKIQMDFKLILRQVVNDSNRNCKPMKFFLHPTPMIF